jgi:hypothetical protein
LKSKERGEERKRRKKSEESLLLTYQRLQREGRGPATNTNEDDQTRKLDKILPNFSKSY